MSWERTQGPVAGRDALTGALDRNGFDWALAEAGSQGDCFGLLLVEIRRLERLSLVHGENAGRMVLQVTAQRLGELLAPDDRLARIGDDRFAIVQARPHERLLAREVALAMEAPFRLFGDYLRVGASVGVGFYPGDGRTPEQLQRHVTMALHAARDDAPGGYRFYAREMERDARVECAMESDLRRALERGELELHYQPQVNVVTGELAGCEALVRWYHPDHGLIGPSRFVPVAESSGLVDALGDWVLRAACGQLASWTQASRHPGRIAVNVSALELADRMLPHRLGRILRETGVDPRLLQLEVTESVAMLDPQRVGAVANAIRELGVGLALDDFGSGFSSFSALNLIAADTLKLDGALVAGLASGTRTDRAIVGSAINLGHELGMFVVAEGVETADQVAAVRELGCDLAQGHFYAADMAADVFELSTVAGGGAEAGPTNDVAGPLLGSGSA